MISTIIPTLGRRAAAGLLRRRRRNRGFFLPAESVAPRKCIAVSFDFHGLRRRFGPLGLRKRPRCRSRRACARASAVEGAIFEHRNADMLDPWLK
jgi:hypothetical protein